MDSNNIIVFQKAKAACSALAATDDEKKNKMHKPLSAVFKINKKSDSEGSKNDDEESSDNKKDL